MAQSVTLTETERVLILVSTPNTHELVEDNYTIWRRRLEITLLTANLAWNITEDQDISEEFPNHHKPQLISAVLNHIHNSISHPFNIN